MYLHKRMAALSLCLLIILVITSACQPNVPQGSGSVQDVINYLTAPDLLGRAVGTEGNAKAGQHIAQQFAAMGIKLFFADYLSPYPQVIYDPVLAAPRLEILWKDSKVEILEVGKNYSLNLARGMADVELAVTRDIGIANPEKYALLADGIPINQHIDKGFGLALTKWGASSIQVHKTRQDVVEANRYQSIALQHDLYQRIEAGEATLRFFCADGKKEITAHNIIGRLKGADSGRAFVVSAHFDGAGGSKERFCSGAVDNASGVAAMLRCASLLSSADALPYDVVFCAFNGEETALQGSASIAKTIESEYKECININIDCVGQIGADVYSVTDDEYEYFNSPLVAAFTDLMDRLGLKHSPETYGGSDHLSFTCPTLVIGAIDPVFHTTNDTVDKLNNEEIEKVGKLVAQFITEYTGEFSWTPVDGHDEEKINAAYLSAALAAIEERRDLADALAYDEAYSFALREGVYVTISGKRLLNSTECEAFFPGIALPDQAGPYRLQGISVADGRDMTVDDPSIYVRQGPPHALDSVFKLDLRPTSAIAVYESTTGNAIQLMVQKDRGDTEYADPHHEKQEGITAEGDLYLFLWEGQAVFARYRRGGLAYTLAFISPDSPHETMEDYGRIAKMMVSKEKLMELVEAFDLVSLDAALN